MNEEIKKIYDYVTKLENYYQEKENKEESTEGILLNSVVKDAYCSVRKYIEDIVTEGK